MNHPVLTIQNLHQQSESTSPVINGVLLLSNEILSEQNRQTFCEVLSTILLARPYLAEVTMQAK
jgi:hypothetical protein